MSPSKPRVWKAQKDFAARTVNKKVEMLANRQGNTRTNAERRPREYLLPDEIDALLKAATQTGRHQLRDRTLILLAYRHALRVTELVELRENQFEFERNPIVNITRLKNGTPSAQPLMTDEVIAVKKLLAGRKQNFGGYLFMNERGLPISADSVRKILRRAGKVAGLEKLAVHPHMLRHSTGYKFINNGTDIRIIQAYLGHKNIQHTTHYTALSPERFKNLWK